MKLAGGGVVNGFFFNSNQHILNRPKPFQKEGIEATQVWLPRRPHLSILPVSSASERQLQFNRWPVLSAPLEWIVGVTEQK